MSGLDELLKGAKGSGGGGLGDLLGGILGGGAGRAGGGALGGNPMLRMLLPAVASMLMNGGLQKILSRLQANGRGTEAESWVSPGANQPVGADDVRKAVDGEELSRIAQHLGVTEDEAAEAVAQVLPDVVDQATPGGAVPEDEELDEKFGRLHELGPAR